jgi:hypothetical protein
MKTHQTSPAKALHRAHAVLLKDLQTLEEAARPTSVKGLAKLRTRLRATRNHITAHFRFEEQEGYMDAVRKREPRLERTVRQLVQEHGQLAASLEALVRGAETATRLEDRLCKEVHAWVERVRGHERRENELVQNTFGLDIGAED